MKRFIYPPLYARATYCPLLTAFPYLIDFFQLDIDLNSGSSGSVTYLYLLKSPSDQYNTPITGIMFLYNDDKAPEGWVKIDKDLNHNVTIKDDPNTRSMFLALKRD